MDEFNIFDDDLFKNIIEQVDVVDDIEHIENVAEIEGLYLEAISLKRTIDDEITASIFNEKSFDKNVEKFIKYIEYISSYYPIFKQLPKFNIQNNDRYVFNIEMLFERDKRVKAILWFRYIKNIFSLFSKIFGNTGELKINIMSGPNLTTISQSDFQNDKLYAVYPIIKKFYGDCSFYKIAQIEKYVPNYPEIKIISYIKTGDCLSYNLEPIQFSKEINSALFGIYQKSEKYTIRNGKEFNIFHIVNMFDSRVIKKLVYPNLYRDYEMMGYDKLTLYPSVYIKSDNIVINFAFNRLFKPDERTYTMNQCTSQYITIESKINSHIINFLPLITDNKELLTIVKMKYRMNNNFDFIGDIV